MPVPSLQKTCVRRPFRRIPAFEKETFCGVSLLAQRPTDKLCGNTFALGRQITRGEFMVCRHPAECVTLTDKYAQMLATKHSDTCSIQWQCLQVALRCKSGPSTQDLRTLWFARAGGRGCGIGIRVLNPYDGGVMERKEEEEENGDDRGEENNRQTISGQKSKKEATGQRLQGCVT